MSLTSTPLHPAPFDALADRYDQVFTDSLIGQAQRVAIWQELHHAFRAGDNVLEVGCGTGVDACFLAERNINVVACDNSSRMVEITTQRVDATGHRSRVKPKWLAAENIECLTAEGPFDGAFSNFGALNCVSDLAKFADRLGSLLRTGATALFCLMGPFCLWEVGWYLARGNPRKAFRRFRRGGVTARLGEGPPVQVFYPNVHRLEQLFWPKFRLAATKGIGVVVPPSYLEPLASRWPSVVRLGSRADSLLGRVPGVRLLADHILLTFVRRQS